MTTFDKFDKRDINKGIEQIQGAIEILLTATLQLAEKQESLFNAVEFETPQERSAASDIHRNIRSAQSGLNDSSRNLQIAKNTLNEIL